MCVVLAWLVAWRWQGIIQRDGVSDLWLLVTLGSGSWVAHVGFTFKAFISLSTFEYLCSGQSLPHTRDRLDEMGTVPSACFVPICSRWLKHSHQFITGTLLNWPSGSWYVNIEGLEIFWYALSPGSTESLGSQMQVDKWEACELQALTGPHNSWGPGQNTMSGFCAGRTSHWQRNPHV